MNSMVRNSCRATANRATEAICDEIAAGSCTAANWGHLAPMLARCSASCFVAVLLTAPATAGIVAIGASQDATLYESSTGALGNGSGQYLFGGTTNQPQLRRALLAFDVISALPQNAMIQSVSLRLHVAGASALTHSFSLHTVTSPWTEGASDATGNEGSGTAAMTGDATWLHAAWPGIMWSTAGGDFPSTASAAAMVGDIGFYSWTSAQLTSDVQNWIATPTSNFGWILRGDESAPGTTRRFDSSESFESSFRPQLVIQYSTVPTPGTFALLTLASVVASKQRRRMG